MIIINEKLYQKMPEDIKKCFIKLPNYGSEEVKECFPYTKSGNEMKFGSIRKKQPNNLYKLGFTQKDINNGQQAPDNYGDEGSASRFFKFCPFEEEDFKAIIYCPKASKKERTNFGELYKLKSNVPKKVKEEIKKYLNNAK